ncbi:heavy metal translocating P-type ATPase [Corynebacterium fournieri]|uniref:heavy metal translocating P-type ATPase n=1 Tax=Corynebacterium fournieri TaxID=1852390 RepID=UPI000A2F0FC2|nr:cation-translocating P-type ATPase [Corynebacterium fournieri]
MSSACGCEHEPATEIEELDRPWWKDPELLLPIFSGIALCIGLALDWSGLETPATVLFWVGLLLGAYTFAPGAIRNLVTKRKLGIGLLMTISAVGAVILGYVGEAAALAFLYSIAEALEDKAMDRAQGGLRALLKLVPQTATVLRDGTSVEVAAKDLVAGELMLVRPGERIATDGIIRSGRSSLDTSAITGESIPEEVAPGDEVPAGAINSAGVLEVETTAAGTDNSLTTLVDLVEQAQAEKGDRARIADRIAQPLVPGVMILAVLVGVIGSLLGDPETWITRALVVLVAASPCALAISVPLVVPADGLDRAQVLTLAAAVERQSTHPLAAAIAAAGPEAPAALDISEEAGHGIGGTVEGRRVLVGSPRWIDAGPLKADVERMESEGQTCVLVTVDDTLAGAIGVRDELRPEVPEAVQTLRSKDVEVSMLTGDNTRTARALAEIAGIDDVRAELRPEDKASIVAEFSSKTPTAMIGDGINDAPALAGATVGIAMGATGSDAAIDSADVAFTGHDLRLIPQALQHARRGSRIINQNIVLSLAIIIVLMPLAISGVLGLAAVVLVHEVAEVIVILNGLRAARAKR